MASDGSRGPKPFHQTTVSTCFLRVPLADWPAVRWGAKREFRGSPGRASRIWSVETPTPVVAYTIKPTGHDAALMVLERVWRHMLGAMEPEWLAAEGFSSFAEFRRYWVNRERKHFRATREVIAYRVRPWTPNDRHDLGDALLRRLYGDWLDEAIGDRAG